MDVHASTVQTCARCGARWPVVTAPARWCSRCRGVLMAPMPADRPAVPRVAAPGRPFRWVATALPGPRRVRLVPRRTPTPSYREIPRWGLIDRPVLDAVDTRSRVDRLADRLPALLRVAAIAFGVAALAEAARYLLLVIGRTRLINPFVLGASDAVTVASGVVATALGITAAVFSVGWMVSTRRQAHAAIGATDPRRWWAITLGCLMPGVNLVMPGVLLHELSVLAPRRVRFPRVVRRWWAVWVLNWVMVAVLIAWRFREPTVQVLADGVLLTIVGHLAAAATAVLTLAVVRAYRDQSLRGDARALTRWTVAPPGATVQR